MNSEDVDEIQGVSPKDTSLQDQASTKPNMGAVYILLGCLTLSGLVILAILIYCTSQCWKKKCLKFRKRSNVSVKLISASDDDRYANLKHSRPKMNGLGKSSFNSVTPTMDKLRVEGNGNCAQLLLGVDVEEDRYSLRTTDETTDFDMQLCHQNGDMALSRAIRHYDIAYDKNNTSCFRGTLTFALRYDYIHRVLMVHVIRAGHLPSKDKSAATTDPYVKMYLLPDRRNHCKTRMHRKTLDPEFNEMFSFESSYQQLPHRMLQFTVYDFDRFSRHDLIGNVIMRDLFERSDLYTWTEYTMQIIASNDKDDYGDLLMYLTYERDEGRVNFQIAKAYNLRPMDITGASDPYVKIYQLQGQRRIKTKRTTTKKQNLNPVYNESLVFDVSEAQLPTTNFLVKVMDWDRIGSDDLLGCAIIGNESLTPEGKEQWDQALGSPHKVIGKWHALLADIPDRYTKLSKK